MTEIPGDVDPALSTLIASMRNRFGIAGLKQAQQLIAVEIAIFDEAYSSLGPDQGENDTSAVD